MTTASHGIILFGHGARDARWAEPFQRLRVALLAARHAVQDSGPVALAFLELMEPSLPEALAEQAAAGCAVITIIPVFLGRGGHIRRDLPALVAAGRDAHPALEIRCADAAGEDEAVLAAITGFCLKQLG